MKLIFKHKFSCGNHRYYPNCKASSAIALIKSSPALSEIEIGYLYAVGFEIELQEFEDEYIKEARKKFKNKKEEKI